MEDGGVAVVEEAWKMGGYWKMSERASERASAVSNLLIEMGLALITEGGPAAPPGDSRQIEELIEVTAMKIWRE